MKEPRWISYMEWDAASAKKRAEWWKEEKELLDEAIRQKRDSAQDRREPK